jgi:hypothetical protein
MAAQWKLGILTGRGDVPGLNSCIRAFTYRALDDGHEAIGIRRGWRGVASLNPDDPAGPAPAITPQATSSAYPRPEWRLPRGRWAACSWAFGSTLWCRSSPGHEEAWLPWW